MLPSICLLVIIAAAFGETTSDRIDLCPGFKCHVSRTKRGIFSPLEQLKEIVNGGVAKAEETLNGFKGTIEKQAAEVVSQAQGNINSEQEDYVNQLKEIEENGQKQGMDISHCIRGRGQELINIPITFSKEAVTCGTDKVAEGKAVFDKSIAEVRGFIGTVKELSDEYNGCSETSILTRGGCYVLVAGKVTGAITNIPIQITSVVTNAQNYVGNFNSDLKKCALGTAVKATDRRIQLLSGVRNCVKSQI